MLRQDVAGCRRKRGHVAQRTVEVAELGRGATDAAIFDFARKHGADPILFMSWAYADKPEMTEQLAVLGCYPQAM